MIVSLVKPYAGYIESMVRHYVIAGLWASLDNRNGTSAELYGLDETHGPDDVSDEAMASIEADCRDFVMANWSDLEGMDPEQAGHDFLLTRDHHGAGFWDRGLGVRGDRLTKAAHAYGDSGFYAGADGQVHVS